MSNFPPGVTGNEPQIAGPEREFDEERTCGESNVTVKSIGGYGARSLDKAINVFSDGTYPSDTARVTMSKSYVRSALGDIEDVALDECPFVGMVTIQWSQGYETWECPLCRTQHEKEIDE